MKGIHYSVLCVIIKVHKNKKLNSAVWPQSKTDVKEITVNFNISEPCFSRRERGKKKKKLTNDVPVITSYPPGRSFQEGLLGIQNEYRISVELPKLLLKHITVMIDKCEKLC